MRYMNVVDAMYRVSEYYDRVRREFVFPSNPESIYRKFGMRLTDIP